jgi:hypothetical protein
MASDPSSDEQTVTPEGESVQRVPEGVTFRDAVTHIDDRGTVTELFDQRWGWHKDPLVFTYAFTIRPGMIKGWGMHKEHEDRSRDGRHPSDRAQPAALRAPRPVSRRPAHRTGKWSRNLQDPGWRDAFALRVLDRLVRTRAEETMRLNEEIEATGGCAPSLGSPSMPGNSRAAV